MNKKIDELISSITLLLSGKLHRPLVFKKSTDPKILDYFIFDPIIKYLPSTRKDYRSGFRMTFVGSKIRLGFCTMYNKNLFNNIKDNFDKDEFENYLNSICNNKKFEVLWSSSKKSETILCTEVEEFKNIFNDLGYKGKHKGSHLEVVIKLNKELSAKKICEHLESFNPLFLAQFPRFLKQGREGNFRRALEKRYIDNNLKMECARVGCVKTKLLEACHIEPYSLTQNNSPENGIFMCHNHHYNEQEGMPLSEQRKIIKKIYLKGTKLERIK